MGENKVQVTGLYASLEGKRKVFVSQFLASGQLLIKDACNFSDVTMDILNLLNLLLIAFFLLFVLFLFLTFCGVLLLLLFYSFL